jgi:anti-sigma B factor antagonist
MCAAHRRAKTSIQNKVSDWRPRSEVAGCKRTDCIASRGARTAVDMNLELQMDWNIDDLENGLARLVVSGRMDVQGSLAVDPVFQKLAGEKANLVVDMSGVTFLASLGLRTLVMSCKTLAAKGGNLVLFGLQPNVEKVLKSSGLNTMIPVVPDMGSAEALLTK